MPLQCSRTTAGGKGNIGKFIEREPRICSAGVPTAQADEKVSDSLQHYLLKEEADALISDAIIPPPKPRPLPPLRRPIPPDLRNAGPHGDVAALINPPEKTKFQQICEDLKETSYKSYWKTPLGAVQDPVPMLPEGFDIAGTTFGKKTPFHGRLYDIVMPKVPYPDKTPHCKKPGVQIHRNYCSPPFDPSLTYGYRTNVDKRGRNAKCCLTDDRVKRGTANICIMNTVQANLMDIKQPRIGQPLTPNDNISVVPEGYTFGLLRPPDNLPECLTFCEINSGNSQFRKCLGHLNALRKGMAKRFLPSFYNKFLLNLKFLDKEKTGWLDKHAVYELCAFNLIRFDPTLIEPLLVMWNSFDETTHKINYERFVHILHHKKPLPDLLKVSDIPSDCLDFKTTYGEMVKPGQKADDRLRAGLPSGRYLDKDYPGVPMGYCKAHKVCLFEESDMKSCLNPSVLTTLHVSHRDMYAKREPDVVRGVFERSGETFTDERFNTVWEEAKKYHSQGWVCFETFRRALQKHPIPK